MAELEIHHEVHSSDAFSRTIGVVAAVLGVLLESSPSSPIALIQKACC